MKKLLFLLCCIGSAAHAQTKWTAGSQVFFENSPLNEDMHLLVLVSADFLAATFNDQGIEIGSRTGNILTVKADKKEVEWMLQSAQVLQLEISHLVRPQFKTDSSSRYSSMVHQLQENPLANGITSPVTGKGVIVGIVDIGFDPEHPNFYDTLGQVNRITRYWNQLDNAGNPPQGFSYGSLHTTLSDMVQWTDLHETHGTHVAGIAAGSGFGSSQRKHAGMAFEAELVLVNIRYYNGLIPEGAKGDFLVASPAIIDGINYIFQYADSVGKPAVVNLSWGMHTGPHDGTSLFDLAIENLTGAGKLFVGSSGNSGWGRVHVSGAIKADTFRTLAYNNRNVKADIEDMYIDMWGAAETDFTLSVGLCDTFGNILGHTAWFSTERDTTIHGFLTVTNASFTLDTLEYDLSVVSRYAGNNKPNILLQLWNYTPQTRRALLMAQSDSTLLHAWNSGQILSWGEGGFASSFWGHTPLPGFSNGNGDYVCGENGGTGKKTISVGAYNASVNQWNIDGDFLFGGFGNFAPFTSRGPTVDGRIKPDISAPGENVVSGYNRHVYNTDLRGVIIDTFVWNGITHYYGIASGTSMSGPNATGVVALMLQMDPELTPDEALDILRQSATQDDMTGVVPNNAWGAGKLNGLEAVLLTMGLNGMEPRPVEEWILYPNPNNGTLYISGPAAGSAYVVYDALGKQVANGAPETSRIDLDLSPGLYFLLVSDSGTQRSFRVQVR